MRQRSYDTRRGGTSQERIVNWGSVMYASGMEGVIKYDSAGKCRRRSTHCIEWSMQALVNVCVGQR